MSSQITTRPLPFIALILAHLIWGANFIVAKVTLQEFPPYSLAFMRFAFASLLLAPFFLAETKKVRIKKEDLPKLVSIGVLIVTLNITFFFAGIIRTTAIHASVLTLIIPILSVILGWLLLKEVVNVINIIGILTGLLGALVIIGLPELFLGGFSAQSLFGDTLIILASVVFVFGVVLSREMSKKYSSLVITAIAFMIGTTTFAIPAYKEYLTNPAWFSQITTLGFLGLMYMTFLSSISAYFLFEFGLSKTSVIKADLFQYIEPFIASFLAVTILKEKISVPFIVGAILIIAGVYLGTLAKEHHHRIHKSHRT